MPSNFFKEVFLCAALAAGISGGMLAGAILPVDALRGKKVLFVSGEPDRDHPSDDPLIRAHLAALGLVVTEAHEDAPPAGATGQDLVVISATVDASALKDAYKNTAVPVFTWSANSYPFLAMTGPQLHKDFEVVDAVRFNARTFSNLYAYCVNPTNPIMREVGISRSQLFGTFFLMQTESSWGRPGAGGTVVASFEGDDGEGAIFTYEKGATMCGGTIAPARRAGFYLSCNNFHLLSAGHGPAATDPDQATWWVGQKLFDATLRWALTPPPPSPKFEPDALHARLAQSARGKKLLFVERKHAFEGREADAHEVEYLGALGFVVTVADQEDPSTMAGGQDLVLIASSCSKHKLANKYWDVKAPLLFFDPLMADTYKCAGRRRYTDYGLHGEAGESEDPPVNYVSIVAAWHSLGAGLPAGPVKIIKEPDIIGWAVPAKSAVVIATNVASPDQCCIYSYEKGATMVDGFVAPSRRTFFALDNNAFEELTESGIALYDAALLWTISSAEN